MMNQVSAEALYSATYVENYLDCVENLPNDLQRLISRNRELDVNYLANIRTAEIQKDVLMTTPASNTSRISRAHYKMQQALIAAQEIGDEKMNLVQTILATIESKTKILDQNHRTLDVRRDDNSLNESREPQASGSNTTNTAPPSGERTTKRARRSRQETSGTAATTNDNAVAEHVLRSQASSSNAASTSTGTRRTNNKAGNKKGKKKTTKSNTAQRNEETSPKAEDRIDPDEPTYCLCDQISYGEMIMCDNDLCPIEWFHFSCVSLVTKPKGRWFCPKCRGERPSVMKPKHVFLKELQIYNKEKEEKTY